MQNQSWIYHFSLSARTNLYKDINQSLLLQGKNKVVASNSKEKWKNQPCVFFCMQNMTNSNMTNFETFL